MKIKRIVCIMTVMSILFITSSMPCFAQETVKNIKSDTVNEEENVPLMEVWATIQTTSGTVAVPAGTYVPGASSYYVRLAQASLNTLGYNCGNADGIYGTNTRNAIIRFQNNNGISADGIIGDDTWNTIQMGIWNAHATVPF